MHRHSILTTIFPKCGFHNKTVEELKNSDISNYRCKLLGEKAAIVRDIFEPCEIDGKSYRTDLVYCEAPEGSKEHEAFETLSTEGGDGSRGLNYVSHREYPDGSIRLRMTILIDQKFCKFDNVPEEIKLSRLITRKYLVAMELISVYRSYIEVLKYITPSVTFAASHLQVVFGERGANPIHPTDQDVYRLICSFDSIKTTLEKINGEYPDLIPISTLDDFITANCGGVTPLLEHYYNHWEKVKRVNKRVVSSKTLEYFIHQGLREPEK